MGRTRQLVITGRPPARGRCSSACRPAALVLYATGIPMKLVARKMTISEDTAKQYLGRVREKYSRAGRAAPTKSELYYRAVEDGHLPLLP